MCPCQEAADFRNMIPNKMVPILCIWYTYAACFLKIQCLSFLSSVWSVGHLPYRTYITLEGSLA